MATIVSGMMTAQITETNRAHTEATFIYHTYHDVDQAFQKLIVDAFEYLFLNELSDGVIGNTNCMSPQSMSHLLTYYPMIAPTELTKRYERLNTPYDPNQLIKMLVQQIQDSLAFVVVGGQPYINAMIVNVAFTLVFSNGLFPNSCCT
jgi:hypothetical protein